MMWLLFVPFSAVGLEGTATALRWPPGERSCGRGVRAPARPPPGGARRWATPMRLAMR